MNNANSTVVHLTDYLDKIGANIGDALSKISQQLGVASTYAYEKLVLQQFAEGVAVLITLLLFTALLSVCWTFYFKKKVYIKFVDDFGKFIVSFILFGCTLVLLVTMAINLPESIMKIINPDYYAMKNIADFIQGFVKK